MEKKAFQRQLLTLREGAEYCGFSVWTFRRFASKRAFPLYRLNGGRKLFVDIKDLDTWQRGEKIEARPTL